MKTKLDIIKDVVENQQYTKISMLIGLTRKKVILDFTTANKLLQLFNNAPVANHAALQKLPWDRLCNLAWSK